MQIRYGAYTHAANEAALAISKRPLVSEMGTQYGWEETWTITGRFEADNSVAVANGIATMERAYAGNGGAIYLLDDAGATLRFMLGLTTLGMTKVVGGVEFPESGERDAEFSTWRTYRITVTGRYPISQHPENVYLSFAESISFSGGVPKRVFLGLLTGRPQEQITQLFTTYKATQQGSAVGLRTRPVIPLPIWPAALVDVQVTPHGPKREGEALIEWRVDWTYTFESAYPLTGDPSIPPP